MKNIKKIFFILFILILSGCQTTNIQKNTKSRFKIGENNVNITSGKFLQSYNDILSGKVHEKKIITGKLYLPKACSARKMPAVIIQHGSGHPKIAWYKKLAKILNKNGIVALVPDSMTNRGITETSTDQSKLSKGTRLYDTFSAFRFLHDIECVEPSRIGITGYSFGGIIARDSVEKVLADKLGNGLVYKASLPVYPSCQANFKNTAPTSTKVHLLLAELDDYTPASYCIEDAKIKKSKGWNLDVTVFEGAHHGFNHEWKPKYFHNSWTFRDCGKIFTDDNGYEFSQKYNVSTKDGWEKYIGTMTKNCGKKGVTMGGSKELSKKTLDFTIKFFRENL
jgi:dienelactone hydrolase